MSMLHIPTHEAAWRVRLAGWEAKDKRKRAAKRSTDRPGLVVKSNGRSSFGDFFQYRPQRGVGRSWASNAPKSPRSRWLFAAGYLEIPF
jgi:hypothetical protein